MVQACYMDVCMWFISRTFCNNEAPTHMVEKHDSRCPDVLMMPQMNLQERQGACDIQMHIGPLTNFYTTVVVIFQWIIDKYSRQILYSVYIINNVYSAKVITCILIMQYVCFINITIFMCSYYC